MINFQNRADTVPSALIVLSVLILAGCLFYSVLVRKPDPAQLARGRALSLKSVLTTTDRAKADGQTATEASAPRLWGGDAESVTAGVLSEVTKQAGRRDVKLAAFRPQRPIELPGVTELTYSVQLTGPYGPVHQVIASLDSPGSKIALQSIQLATAEGPLNPVSATVGVAALLPNTSPVQTTSVSGAVTNTGAGVGGVTGPSSTAKPSRLSTPATRAKTTVRKAAIAQGGPRDES